MLSEVQAHGFILLGRTQTDDGFHDERDDGRGDHGPHDGQHDSLQLVHEQTFLERSHDAVDVVGRQDAGEDRAERSTDAMHTERIKGVVITEPRLEFPAREEGNDTRQDADDHCAGSIHETASRGDHHQTRDDAGAESQDAGLALDQPFHHRPDEASRGRCERGGGEGVGGDAVRPERAARVEAVPADPEHARADHTKHHAVRGHRLFREAQARLEDQAEDQGRPTGGHVHHRAAGEVNGFDRRIRIERAAHETVRGPNHVSEREVNREHPDGNEQQHRRELHAFGDCADDERRGDDGERELEDGPHIVRDPVIAMSGFGAGDTFEHGEIKASEEGAFVGERQAIAAQPPEDGDQSGDAHTLRHHGQHVLFANEAAVEQCQTRQGHEQHQRGGGHLPCVVARTRAANFGHGIGRAIARTIVDVSFEVFQAFGERALGSSSFVCGVNGGGVKECRRNQCES